MSGALSAAPDTGGTSSTGSTIAQVGTTALGSLSDNFTNFLSLLMTQLQNQDPTSPLDSNQFTSELVTGAKVLAKLHFSLAPARLGAILCGCAAAIQSLRSEPS